MNGPYKNTIFQVTAIKARDLESDDDTIYDDKVSIFRETVGYYSTLENAENGIKSCIKKECEWSVFLGFSIREYELNPSEDGMGNVVSSRSYDKDGRFIMSSLCDDKCRIPFRGRNKDEIKFEIGQIVMACYNSEACPVLILSKPPTKEWWNEHMDKDCSGDVTDDSYTIVEIGGGHEHPNSTLLFPLNFKISDKVKSALFEEFKRYVCDFFNSIPTQKSVDEIKEGWEEKLISKTVNT